MRIPTTLAEAVTAATLLGFDPEAIECVRRQWGKAASDPQKPSRQNKRDAAGWGSKPQRRAWA
jgi:hypothetical protein